MTGKLLIGGMLAGLLAALLSFGFLKIVGGPSVERAIAFETLMDEAKAEARAEAAAPKGQPAPVEQAEPELVSRPVQSGIGLLTGVGVLSVAFGGIFGFAFALAYGRMAGLDARATSAVLAGLGFVSVYLTPMLKYPPNPPAVGLSDTIDMRTSLYFALILISVAAMIAAGLLRKSFGRRLGGWNATMLAGAGYIAVMAGVCAALPGVNEVPENFPADLLWEFRLASVGGQAILWATLGLVFGIHADRVVARKPDLRAFRA
jgi:predicted cobalt transporter CbtA